MECIGRSSFAMQSEWEMAMATEDKNKNEGERRKEGERNVAKVAESRHFWHPVLLIYHCAPTSHTHTAALPYKLVTESIGGREGSRV